MNTELELFGHRNLDLRVFARRSKNADALNATFRSDDRELFLTGILTGLREIGAFREFMSFAKQGLHVFLGEMNVVSRNLDKEWLLLLCLQDTRDVRPAQRAQRFTRHHALFVRGQDEYCHFRIISRDAANLVARRVLVAFVVECNAHAFQTLQRKRANDRASLADAAGEYYRIYSTHRGHVSPSVFSNAIAICLKREQRALMTLIGCSKNFAHVA